MGTTVRLLADAPLEPLRAGIERSPARLTRFDPGSELCALNADPRGRGARVAAAPARGPGGAARRAADRRARRPHAARRRRGRRLRAPRVGVEPASLDAALRAAPRAPRGHAGPALARGRGDREASIVRPPGLRIDLGGSAKGLAADWAASQLQRPFVVDCGGDIRVGGTHDVALRGTAHTLRVTDAAVATSGIDRRVLAATRRLVRAPPPGPRHRRAGLDRRDLRHRDRPDGARGRGTGEGRPPVRPGGARAILAAGGAIVVGEGGRAEVVEELAVAA